MSGSRLPLWATIAGVVVGVGIAVSLVATGVLTIPIKRDPRDASADFLKAWERSRTSSFVVDSEFRRTLPDKRVLYSPSRLVQQPPNRLIRQFGGINGAVDGHLVICTTDQGGHFSCFKGDQPAPDYQAEVAHELALFRSYFTIPDSVPRTTVDPFAVTTTTTTTRASTTGGTEPEPPIEPLGLYNARYAPEPGCFELFQRIRYPDAPYGKYAKLCFDERTGAMRSLERHLASDVVETLVASHIVQQVTPLDFDTSQDRNFDMRVDMGSYTPPTAPEEASDQSPGTTTPPNDALKGVSNEDLVVAGSGLLADKAAIAPYIDEAIRRMSEGSLSINDPVWLQNGQPRSLLGPVVIRLLSLGVYLPS